jgi:hypothetical protein
MTAPEPDPIAWRTSSYISTGSACIQVGWRTSSYSAGTGAYVEVTRTPERVLVRDSKDPDGPRAGRPTLAWRAFLAAAAPPRSRA